MRVRVIRTFIDKYTKQDIPKDTIIEVTKERFGELTTGPRGVFVEEIKEANHWTSWCFCGRNKRKETIYQKSR